MTTKDFPLLSEQDAIERLKLLDAHEKAKKTPTQPPRKTGEADTTASAGTAAPAEQGEPPAGASAQPATPVPQEIRDRENKERIEAVREKRNQELQRPLNREGIEFVSENDPNKGTPSGDEEKAKKAKKEPRTSGTLDDFGEEDSSTGPAASAQPAAPSADASAQPVEPVQSVDDDDEAAVRIARELDEKDKAEAAKKLAQEAADREKAKEMQADFEAEEESERLDAEIATQAEAPWQAVGAKASAPPAVANPASYSDIAQIGVTPKAKTPPKAPEKRKLDSDQEFPALAKSSPPKPSGKASPKVATPKPPAGGLPPPKKAK